MLRCMDVPSETGGRTSGKRNYVHAASPGQISYDGVTRVANYLMDVAMADISADLPWRRPPARAYHRLTAYQLLVLAILAVGCWVAVAEITIKDRCKTPLGRLAVELKLDTYYSSCQCMKPALDFRDPCNLILGVPLGLI